MLPWFSDLVSDDRVLAFLQMGGSRKGHPDAAHLRRIEQSLDLGKSAAAAFASGPAQMESFGLNVKVMDGGFHHAGVVRHAEYHHSSRTISVYRESIRSLTEAFELAGSRSPAGIEDVLIMHEVFHYLERAGGRPSGLGRVDEIAAHSFAKSACGFPFMPNGLDWLRLVASGVYTPDQLKAALMQAQVWILQLSASRNSPPNSKVHRLIDSNRVR